MRSRSPRMPVSVDDFEVAAQRRLPRSIFDSIAGGAGDESALRRNRAGFAAWELVPHALQGTPRRELATTVLGDEVSMPVLLGPTGFQRMSHREAELATARAAHRQGTGFVLATGASYSLEDVASESAGVRWFQLYPREDRAITGELIRRARDAGYSALCVTIDTAMFGIRERDRRNQLTIPFKLRPRVVVDCVRRPRWVIDYLRGGVGHMTSTPKLPMSAKEASQVLARHKVDVTEDYLAWIRAQWPGKLVLKGVLRAEDCDRLFEHGVDGVIVSNHGGRQLNSAPPTISVLPEVVDATRGRMEVFLDGGVRRGDDVAKALALGARAVLIGRPYVFGLAVDGEEGVVRVLELLRADLETTIGLLGCGGVDELDRSYLRRPGPCSCGGSGASPAGT